MRISACSIAWQSKGRWDAQPQPELAAADVAARIAAAGATGVEFWEPHLRGIDLADLRLRLTGLGLGTALVSGYYDFTGSLDAAQASLARAHDVLGRARAVGATGIRIFTGKRRGSDTEDAIWERTVGMLRELCDAAGGLLLAAELHDWNLMDTAANAERLMGAVDRPNMGLILHPERLADDLAGGLTRLSPWLRHVHVRTAADGLPDPACQWAQIVAHLRQAGYAGWWSVEHFAPEPDRLVPVAVAALRRLLA